MKPAAAPHLDVEIMPDGSIPSAFPGTSPVIAPWPADLSVDLFV
jgi:hypothetical protein